jgi:hypothetical protein
MPVFSDLNQSTPVTQTLVEDYDSIIQSIKSILTTSRNTRMMLPEFGCDLMDVLFDVLDEASEVLVKNIVIAAINRWEPRVYVDYSQTSVRAVYDEHAYYVIIVFKIRNLGDQAFSFAGLLRK